jgi:hypothetical protein
MTDARTKPKCLICAHPARFEMDDQLLDPMISLATVRDWALENYPDHPVPNVTGFSRHRKEHLQTEMALTPGILTIKDGQVYDGSNRPLEQIGVAAALKAILTIGIRNIMLFPERVTVKDTLDVLKIMKQLGQGEGGDMEEFFNMWASTVVKSEHRGRPKKKIIEAQVDDQAPVIEVIEDNPFAEIYEDNDSTK